MTLVYFIASNRTKRVEVLGCRGVLWVESYKRPRRLGLPLRTEGVV